MHFLIGDLVRLGEQLEEMRSEIPGPRTREVEYLDASNVSLEQCEAIAKLLAHYQKKPGDPMIRSDGCFVAPAQFTPDIVQRYFADGAQAAVLRAVDSGRLLGVHLSFPPDRLPEEAGPLYRLHNKLPHAFVRAIAIDPEARDGSVYDTLHYAALIKWQSHFVASAIGRVEYTNEEGFNAHRRRGWVLRPNDQVVTRSQDGSETRYIAMQLPVSPKFRSAMAHSIPVPRDADSAEARLFRSGRLGFTARLPKEGELSPQQFENFLRCASFPAILRVTGGCGAMTRSDWKGLVDLFGSALEGYEGAIVAGATRMLVRIDEKTTSTWRAGITEIPVLIQDRCPRAITGGILIGDRTQYESDGKDVIHSETIMDLDSAQLTSLPYVTVRNPDYRFYVYENELEGDNASPWDAEYKAMLRYVDRITELEKKLEPGQSRTSSLLVVYNGGGTTRREAQAWAERGMPVVIVEGSGGTADALAADGEWRARYPSVRFVPKDSIQLRHAFTEAGLLRPA